MKSSIELRVVRPVGVDAGLAVAARVPEVGPRACVAGVHRGGHVQVAGATAAAEALGPPVPRALHAAGAAVRGVERQPDADVDVLRRAGTEQDIDLAVSSRWRCSRR